MASDCVQFAATLQIHAALEREIRQQLGATAESIAFTRQGSFYWGDRASLRRAVKWFYIVLVGCLLFAFLGGRIWEDFRTRKIALAAVDQNNLSSSSGVRVMLPTFSLWGVARTAWRPRRSIDAGS